MALVSSKEFIDIQESIECRFTLKRVCDMIIRYSQSCECKHFLTRTENLWLPVWPCKDSDLPVSFLVTRLVGLLTIIKSAMVQIQKNYSGMCKLNVLEYVLQPSPPRPPNSGISSMLWSASPVPFLLITPLQFETGDVSANAGFKWVVLWCNILILVFEFLRVWSNFNWIMHP